MDANSIQRLIKLCSKLDKTGHYSKADSLFEKIAQYYPQQSVTQSPNVSLVPYEDIEEETKQNDFWRQKINPRKIPKEYRDLGGEADGQNIEGQLHGPDNVPGPAYVDPGNPASSPSMAISNGEDLNDKFSWEETYDKNVDDGNAWKNRIPNR
jgi:hypothetical protein